MLLLLLQLQLSHRVGRKMLRWLLLLLPPPLWARHALLLLPVLLLVLVLVLVLPLILVLVLVLVDGVRDAPASRMDAGVGIGLHGTLRPGCCRRLCRRRLGCVDSRAPIPVPVTDPARWGRRVRRRRRLLLLLLLLLLLHIGRVCGRAACIVLRVGRCGRR